MSHSAIFHTHGKTRQNWMFLCRTALLNRLRCYTGFRGASIVRSLSTAVPNPEGDDFGDYDVILPPEPHVWGVSHIVPRTVPPSVLKPHYALGLGAENGKNRMNYGTDTLLPLGADEERRIRCAARLAKKVLEYAGTLVRVGVTTNSIDAAIHEFIISHSAYPSPLLYQGFPRSCCTSVNNIIAHGIPDDRPLQNGDIFNIDVTVFLDGYHGDTSQTFLVGNVDDQGKQLVYATRQALEMGISACGVGRPFHGIGKAITDSAHASGFSVSRMFTGHGIGTEFHKPPWIIHTPNDEPGIMRPGHCFTIEPSLVQGVNTKGWIFPDGWTASTENCARSAQAEHMVLITETGIDVLTR